MMNKQVRHVMTKDPVVAAPNQDLEQVAQLMMSSNIQQMPVVKEGKLVGMITSHDIWLSSRNQKGQPAKRVQDVMNTRVIQITPIDKLGTAAELFMDKRFKTLPVVNLRGELKGVVTVFDVIRQALIEKYPHPILYKEAFASYEKV